MSPGTRARLTALVERELKQHSRATPTAPPRRSFKPMRLNLDRFDQSWDRKRGNAMRLAGVLLRDDDAALERRVCESAQSAKLYSDALRWLQTESTYLRKVARLLDVTNGRLTSVLARCAASAPEASAQQQ